MHFLLFERCLFHVAGGDTSPGAPSLRLVFFSSFALSEMGNCTWDLLDTLFFSLTYMGFLLVRVSWTGLQFFICPRGSQGLVGI